MFTGADLPPPPFPVREVFAPLAGQPDVRLLVMDPPSQRSGRAAVLYIHGGGMVAGSAGSSLADKPQTALEHDCVVISVDYRLAPETPFPGPQEDCYAALLWLAAAGVTGGCATGRFCPGAAVTRGQMAAFLHRGFGD